MVEEAGAVSLARRDATDISASVKSMDIVWHRDSKHMIRGQFRDATFTLEFDSVRGLWFLQIVDDNSDDVSTAREDQQVHNTFEEAMLSVVLVCTQLDGRLLREADAEAKISSLLGES